MDVYLAKLDSTLTPVWANYYDYGFDGALALLASASGALFVAAQAGGLNYLLRIASDGSLVWARQFSAGGGTIEKMVELNNGNLLLVGSNWVLGQGGQDLWLASIASDGSLSWATTVAGSTGGWVDKGAGASASNDGGFFAVGEFRIGGMFGAPEQGFLKFNASGNFLWGKRISVGGAHDIAELPDGTLATSLFLPSAPDNLTQVIHYDSTGNVLWGRQAPVGGTIFHPGRVWTTASGDIVSLGLAGAYMGVWKQPSTGSSISCGITSFAPSVSDYTPAFIDDQTAFTTLSNITVTTTAAPLPVGSSTASATLICN
ncbi:MAG: hypothetical protein IPJ88_10255 [Myxococcales bacterium]|nr:MAG: hypothetical protein IPJ88_10255 [Myxococcales bacterium]